MKLGSTNPDIPLLEGKKKLKNSNKKIPTRSRPDIDRRELKNTNFSTLSSYNKTRFHSRRDLGEKVLKTHRENIDSSLVAHLATRQEILSVLDSIYTCTHVTEKKRHFRYAPLNLEHCTPGFQPRTRSVRWKGFKFRSYRFLCFFFFPSFGRFCIFSGRWVGKISLEKTTAARADTQLFLTINSELTTPCRKFNSNFVKLMGACMANSTFKRFYGWPSSCRGVSDDCVRPLSFMYHSLPLYNHIFYTKY